MSTPARPDLRDEDVEVNLADLMETLEQSAADRGCDCTVSYELVLNSSLHLLEANTHHRDDCAVWSRTQEGDSDPYMGTRRVTPERN